MIQWANKTFLDPQVEGVRKLLAALDSGAKRIVFVSPTGTGKTLMMGYGIHDRFQRDMRVDLRTYRRLLLTQLSGEMDKFGIPHGVVASGMERHADDSQLVQLVMTQTELSRKKKNRIRMNSVPDVLFLDEAHNQLGGESGAEIDELTAGKTQAVLVTATPVGQFHKDDLLIEVGKNSEFRKLGLLLPCKVYGPDEPEAALKLKPTKTGEFREGDVVKAIMSPTIFGRVLEWYGKLNPERLPTILFGPGVKESIWFAEQFRNAGIRSAHIDGEHVWIDGETHAKTQALVNEVKRESENGSIKVVCNRFVLREGLDWPHLYHAILATCFGSLTAYLQSIGRLLRAYPGYDHVIMQDHGGCLDSETEVLTADGWKNRLQISDSDFVAAFDVATGEISFQPILHRHDRPLEEGEQMFSAAGKAVDIRVTGNHRMVLKKRTCDAESNHVWPSAFVFEPAVAAAKSKVRFKIPIAGFQQFNGVPLRDCELRFIGWFLTDGTRCRTEVSVTQANHQPQIEDLRVCLSECGFDWREHKQQSSHFPGSKPATKFAIPKGTCKSKPRHGWVALEKYLDKDLSPHLEEMTNHQFEVLLHAIHLGDGAKAKGNGGTYSISTGNAVFADRLQSACVRRGYKCNIAKRPGCKTLILNIQKTTETIVHGAHVVGGQLRLQASLSVAGERVWCVANKLETLVTRRNGKVAIIGNSWWRHGSPNADRIWTLGWDATRYAEERAKAIREKKDPEPIVCPSCGAVRLVGPSCATCGHTASAKGRMVIQKDGSLRLVKGDIFKERPVVQRSNTEKLWEQCFWRCRKTGKTFRQAYGLFVRENHYAPPKNLPNMPRESVDWYAKISDVPWGQLFPRKAAQQSEGLFK